MSEMENGHLHGLGRLPAHEVVHRFCNDYYGHRPRLDLSARRQAHETAVCVFSLLQDPEALLSSRLEHVINQVNDVLNRSLDAFHWVIVRFVVFHCDVVFPAPTALLVPSVADVPPGRK